MSSSDYIPMNAELAAKLTKAIGITTGITLQQAKEGASCKPYRVRVYDGTTDRHATKSFRDTDKLVDFAREKWAAFEGKTETAGRVTLESVLPGFIASLKTKGNKPKTIAEIQRIFDAAIVAGVSNLKAPDIAKRATEFLDNYRPEVGYGRRRSQQSAATRLRYVGHFRALGKYCCMPTLKNAQRGMLQVNPFMAMVRPKLSTTLMNILALNEARALVSDEALREVPQQRHPAGAPNGGEISAPPYKDGVYFAARLYTGQRQSETAWLRWEHFLWDAKLIRVTLPDAVDWAEAVRLKLVREGEDPTGRDCQRGKQVKGNKERFCILSDELAEIMIKLRPASGRGYVFRDEVRSRDSSADGSAFRSQLKRMKIERPELTPHDLRSTNACLWLAGGLGESQLRNHLGHTTLRMTSHYAARANEYRSETRDWAGEIRLRAPVPGCKKGATATTPEAHSSTDDPGPGDEVDDCVLVILPENSPLFAG